MLLQNKSFLSCNGLRYLVGSANLSGVLSRNALGGTGNTKKNRYLGEASMYKGDATPSGLTPITGAWYPNIKTGGMSSRYQIKGSGTITPPVIAGGLNGSVTMPGQGSITTLPYMRIADHFIINVTSLTSLGQISSSSSMKGVIAYNSGAPVVLSGSGTIPTVLLKILAWCTTTNLTGHGSTNADMSAPIALASSLVSSGSITYAAMVGIVSILGHVTGNGTLSPGIKFPANLISALTGRGNIPNTLTKALAWCVADVLAHGQAGGTLRGNSSMAAAITSQGELVTPQSCAQAVWEAVASIHNSSGTMGNKMNSASAAGDPWTAEIPGVYINGSAGATLEQIVKLVNDNQALILAK